MSSTNHTNDQLCLNFFFATVFLPLIARGSCFHVYFFLVCLVARAAIMPTGIKEERWISSSSAITFRRAISPRP